MQEQILDFKDPEEEWIHVFELKEEWVDFFEQKDEWIDIVQLKDIIDNRQAATEGV